MLTKALGIGAAVLAILAGALALRLDAQEAKTDKARTEAKVSNDRADSERVARIATEDELIRAETIARKTKDALDEAHQATQAATADALRARRAGDSLRQYAADLAARANKASRDCTPASAGPAASSPADLLAYMSGRIDEASDGIAEFAEGAHAAGTACERISDAVSQ